MAKPPTLFPYLPRCHLPRDLLCAEDTALEHIARKSISQGEVAAMRQIASDKDNKPRAFCLQRQLAGAFLAFLLCIIFACVELSEDHPRANDMLGMTRVPHSGPALLINVGTLPK